MDSHSWVYCFVSYVVDFTFFYFVVIVDFENAENRKTRKNREKAKKRSENKYCLNGQIRNHYWDSVEYKYADLKTTSNENTIEQIDRTQGILRVHNSILFIVVVVEIHGNLYYVFGFWMWPFRFQFVFRWEFLICRRMKVLQFLSRSSLQRTKQNRRR